MKRAGSDVLATAQRRTLDAIARRLVPSAFDGADPVPDLTERLVDRIGQLPSHKREDVRLVLRLIGSPVAALATVGRWRSFAELGTEAQDLMLARWATSRLGVCRTSFQALRRLTMALYYSLPAGQRAVGYLGPYHLRAPRFPWEGPVGARDADRVPSAGDGEHMPAADRDDDVVVRAAALAGEGAAAERTAAVAPNVAPHEPRSDPPGTRGSPPNFYHGGDSSLEHNPDVASTTGGTLGDASAMPIGIQRPLIADVHTTADIVVIGTGAGGAVVAALLAEAGLDVVMLEAGGFYTGASFTEQELEMTEALYAERGSRSTEDLGVAILQGEAVGGGTAVNWMVMLRTPDHVLEEWAIRHGVEGMSPGEMRAWFEQVERDVHARPVPPDAHSPNNRIILDGARVLGWRATAATINARGCLRTGYCGQGCRYDAKQGAHLTYVPRALRAGARLFTRARAERVALVERGSRRARKRVVATVGAPSSDRQCQLTIDAPTVVVAAGAIETPALLQRSGLGGGGVGRFLRLHPTTAVIGIYDRPIYAAAGIPLSAVCDEFSRSDANGYGFWIECPPLHPALAAVAAPSFGESHASVMRQFANMGALIALVRDGADRERSTGSVMVDRRGRTRINYRIGPRDAAHLSAAIAAATRLHFSNGSSEVRSLHTRATVFRNEADLAGLRSASHAPNDVGLFSAHVTGTCRIGTDSRTSGVTPNFERHGAPGVFVCDGSLLPTAPGVNPQETIMAMAMIVASRVHASASA